jgi:hypothetical protein
VIGAARDPGLWRRVLVPSEHGSWAFLGEPILLGLLVAPSGAGWLVALAALAVFLARRPLKILVSDRRARARYPRTPVAEWAVAACAGVGALALAGAVLAARGPVLLACGLAAPLGVVSLAFDLARRSREAGAEVAGAVALGAVSSAVALAAGWALAPALGLWAVLAARAVPSVAYVRARLRLDKGQPARVGGALLLHLAAIAGGALLARAGLVPGLAVAAMALLALRAAYGLSPARPRMTTLQLGLTEIFFGLLTVLSVWAGGAGRS